MTVTPPQFSIIVPTFNEAQSIEPLYEALDVALGQLAWEMIVVDDDSPDKTADVARALANKKGNIRVIRRIGRRGLSSACIEGMLASAAPVVGIMDADLQHDESRLPQMILRVQAGADIVVGTRYGNAGSADDGFDATRLQGSMIATRISSIVTKKITTDPMSGFFVINREVFENIAEKLTDEGFKILLDLLVTAEQNGKALRVEEVPYEFRPRQVGESKMSPVIVAQFVGLWISKFLGGWLPPSFFLFAIVGLSGVVVHMLALSLAHFTLGWGFLIAQTLATWLAMTWNFWLNNNLTYADRKLAGLPMLRGLLIFYAVCSLGALANISVASVLFSIQPGAYLAGFAGALMSSVFNYSVTRMFTWR